MEKNDFLSPAEEETVKTEAMYNPDDGIDLQDTFIRRFFRHKMAVAGLIVLLIMFFLAILAPVIAPYDPNGLTGVFRAPPSGDHILGTDKVSRDLFSRLIYATRVSLIVGFGTMFFGTVIGTVLGLVSGYFGGKWDLLIMRAADVIMIFPPMMLILVMVSVFKPGIWNIIIILGFLGWPAVARLVRGRVLSIKEENYIKSAKVIGLKTPRILFAHILPNTLSPILVNATFRVSSAIMTESALSFLGLGVQPPTASWGNMLNDAQALSTLDSRPWLWAPAGTMILLCVLSINFIGDGLRDALDPQQH